MIKVQQPHGGGVATLEARDLRGSKCWETKSFRSFRSLQNWYFLLCFFLILEKFVYLVDLIYCFASCLSRVWAFLETKNHVESFLNDFVFSFSFFIPLLSVLASVLTKSLWTALAQETGAAERSGASGQPRTTETGGLEVNFSNYRWKILSQSDNQTFFFSKFASTFLLFVVKLVKVVTCSFWFFVFSVHELHCHMKECRGCGCQHGCLWCWEEL